jgi:hypothetical protein
MLTTSRTRIRRLTALSGAALVTAAVIAASTQAGVGGAEASVTAGQPVTSPYSSAHNHHYQPAAGLTDVVTVTNPGPQSGYKGHPETLQIKAISTFGLSLHYQQTGLPGGLAINPNTGLISGTPRYGADPPITSTVTVTATDSLGKHGSATFTWSIDWIQHCTPPTCT